MTATTTGSNGVIRIGRKGVKKFAFGDDGAPFEVDVVVAFQQWIALDAMYRIDEQGHPDDGTIPQDRIPEYHHAAVEFVDQLRNNGTRGGVQPHDGNRITTAEALDFLARLRECYDEVAAFFRPKSREERASQDSSAVELRFSAEKDAS